MATRHRMTRAELNQRAWEQKKVKKKKGLARGTRSNPNIVEIDISATSSNKPSTTAKPEKVVRAIPLNIPGRDTPLVSEKVIAQAQKVAEQQQSEKETGPIKSVDLVNKNGKLVATKPTAKSKTRKVSSDKKSDKTPNTEKPVKAIKLGKAALKRLEREEVGFGQEVEFFENYQKEKAERKAAKRKEQQPAQSEFEKDLNTSNRVLSRDYKTGRNADYTRSQANAEKAIRAKKAIKPVKRSGEELLDLWDSMK